MKGLDCLLQEIQRVGELPGASRRNGKWNYDEVRALAEEVRRLRDALERIRAIPGRINDPTEALAFAVAIAKDALEDRI